ncbi:MAG: hypothetical protein U1F57_00815 [bacterium]
MKRRFFCSALLLASLISFSGCGDKNGAGAPPVSDASDNIEVPLQIFIKGESQPLTALAGRHFGDVILLETKGQGSHTVQWWSADPQSLEFKGNGELHIHRSGRYLIGALTEDASSYVTVEILSSPSSAGAGKPPPSGNSPSDPPESQPGDPPETQPGDPPESQPGDPPESQPGNEPPASVPSDPFMDEVISFHPGPHAGFGSDRFPQIVLGSPKGAGLSFGGFDVLSLGVGGEIVLKSDTPILDETGPDFIVFENAFYAGGNPNAPFAEPGEVAVSQDGIHFIAFPCASTDSVNHYPGCAGVHPVFANPDTNSISPTDPAVAGGDAFDLHDLDLG